MTHINKSNWKEGQVGTTKELFPFFKCPNCKEIALIDQDQFEGRVSIDCPNCEYHETKDWRE